MIRLLNVTLHRPDNLRSVYLDAGGRGIAPEQVLTLEAAVDPECLPEVYGPARQAVADLAEAVLAEWRRGEPYRRLANGEQVAAKYQARLDEIDLAVRGNLSQIRRAMGQLEAEEVVTPYEASNLQLEQERGDLARRLGFVSETLPEWRRAAEAALLGIWAKKRVAAQAEARQQFAVSADTLAASLSEVWGDYLGHRWLVNALHGTATSPSSTTTPANDSLSRIIAEHWPDELADADAATEQEPAPDSAFGGLAGPRSQLHPKPERPLDQVAL